MCMPVQSGQCRGQSLLFPASLPMLWGSTRARNQFKRAALHLLKLAQHLPLDSWSAGCGSELRADVARAVTALASAGVISDAADVAHWRAWALSSLMDARHAPPLSQPGLSQLAADADAEGLQEEGAAAAARAAVRSACVAALEGRQELCQTECIMHLLWLVWCTG